MEKLFLKLFFLICFGALPMLMPYAVHAQNNTLILNGAYITLNGGTSATPIYVTINQSNTAGISRISGHIISESQYNYVKWLVGTGTGSYVVPFGYSTTDYLPFTFNKTTAGSTSVSLSTWASNNQNMPHAGVSDNGTVPAVFKMRSPYGDSLTTAVDRWWDIYSPSAVTANLTFSYRGVENATTSDPTTVLDAEHWNGSTWDTPLAGSTAGVTTGVGSTTVTGATTFSPWVLVHTSMPLPVTLSSFTTICLNDGVKLQWTTSSEKNSDYYEIERSFDGTHFLPVAKVTGAGDSEEKKKYEYVDHEATITSYYRLSQFDFDGTSEYLKTIRANCELPENETVSIYPNPAADVLNYSVFLNSKGIIALEICDETGQSRIIQQFIATAGRNILSTNISALNDGFYYVKINYGMKTSLIKFVKVN